MDLITRLPPVKGKDAILTIVDQGCSHAAIFLLCSTTIIEPGITQLYHNHVFWWFGLPTKIISDRDLRFTLHFGRAFVAWLGIEQNLSMAFHPQMDGLSEWKNQWIEQYLRLTASCPLTTTIIAVLLCLIHLLPPPPSLTWVSRPRLTLSLSRKRGHGFPCCGMRWILRSRPFQLPFPPWILSSFGCKTSLALHNSPEFYHRFSQGPPFLSPLQPPPWILWLGGQTSPQHITTFPWERSLPRRGPLLRPRNFPCLTSSTPSDAAGSYQWSISGPRPYRPKRPMTEKFFGSSSLPSSMLTWSSALLRLSPGRFQRSKK
jgi:hypothetical protein